MDSDMDDSTLRQKLTELGVDVGPINMSTRPLYLKKLQSEINENKIEKRKGRKSAAFNASKSEAAAHEPEKSAPSVKSAKTRKSKSPGRVQSDPGAQNEVSYLSDTELRKNLSELGVDVGPITLSSRTLYEKKLQDLLASENNTRRLARKHQSFDNVEDDIEMEDDSSNINNYLAEGGDDDVEMSAPMKTRKSKSFTQTPTYSREMDPSPDESYTYVTRRRSRNFAAEPSPQSTYTRTKTKAAPEPSYSRPESSHSTRYRDPPEPSYSRPESSHSTRYRDPPTRPTTSSHRQPAQTLSFTPVEQKYKLIRRSIHDMKFDSDEEIDGVFNRRYVSKTSAMRDNATANYGSKTTMKKVFTTIKNVVKNNLVFIVLLMFVIVMVLMFGVFKARQIDTSPEELRNNYPFCKIDGEKNCINRKDLSFILKLYDPVMEILKEQSRSYHCDYALISSPRLSAQEVLRRLSAKLNQPEYSLEKHFTGLVILCIHNSHWNINVESNTSGVKARLSEEVQYMSEAKPDIPVYCTVKRKIVSGIYVVCGLGAGVALVALVITSAWWFYKTKKAEKEEVNSIVQQIIDILKAAKVKNPANAFLPINVVKSRVFPKREERNLKEQVWSKAEKIISEQESLVATGRGKFIGIEHEMWCWQGDTDD